MESKLASLKLRQDLAAPGLLRTVRTQFEKVTDRRDQDKCDFSLPDTLMSALAVFSMKFPSLLQFDEQARTDSVIRPNLKTLFHVKQAPCDTRMREILDPIDPREIRPTYKAVFSDLQRGKILEDFVYLNDSY